MSSGVITDKKGIEAQMETLGISQEHFTNVEGINSYFDEHKINQLFNVRTSISLVLLINCNRDKKSLDSRS